MQTKRSRAIVDRTVGRDRWAIPCRVCNGLSDYAVTRYIPGGVQTRHYCRDHLPQECTK